MDVYVLQHVRNLGDGDEDVKLIGVFSAEDAGNAAIAGLQEKPGFAEHPNGLHLDKYELDLIGWLDGFASKPPAGHDESASNGPPNFR